MAVIATTNHQDRRSSVAGAVVACVAAMLVATPAAQADTAPVIHYGQVWANPSVNVRTGPHLTDGIKGTAAYMSTVQILCHTFGDQVNQGFWPTNVWDRIGTLDGQLIGFAADTWIYTTYDVVDNTELC